MNLQSELLTLNPAEFKLALQTDVQLVPIASTVPYLELSIKPEKAGGFEPRIAGRAHSSTGTRQKTDGRKIK
jgi:hypothetical protein